MRPTVLQTLTLPQVSERQPAAICYATDRPCRVMLKNLSGAIVFVGFASADVQDQSGPGTQSWQIQPAQTDIFVLAPKQTLYGAANAPNALVCMSVSEALPPL